MIVDSHSCHPDSRESSVGHKQSWRELLDKIAAGDDSALEAFYDETHQFVYGVALRFVGDPDTAEEVTLDVYVQVWRSAKTFSNDRSAPLTWLSLMARSRAIDSIRSRAAKLRSSNLSLEEARESKHEGPSPLESAEVQELRRNVKNSLDALPEKERRLIDLAWFEGQSHREIAQSEGMPLGTVKTLIRNGLMSLRRSLACVSAGGPS